MTLVLIKNASVFAPEPLGTQHLLIGGGRVLWMGTDALELPVPLRKVSTTIDAAGLRTVPGLIDSHVHVTGGGGEAGFRTRVPPVPLSRFTTAGITTVISFLRRQRRRMRGLCHRSNGANFPNRPTPF